MQRILWVLLTLVACSGAFSAAAKAQGPAFDCTKAKGEVELLICSDPALAALDRQLAEVYKAASAKAQGDLVTSLRTEQRGWVKGRDECWKATSQTWITATWTVGTVKDCVDAQYRLRISELQALWHLVEPKTVNFTCQNNPANVIVADFFETDPPTIRLERGDSTKTLWRVGPASDGNYEGQNVSLVHKGSEVNVEWLNTNTGETDVLQCRMQ